MSAEGGGVDADLFWQALVVEREAAVGQKIGQAGHVAADVDGALVREYGGGVDHDGDVAGSDGGECRGAHGVELVGHAAGGAGGEVPHAEDMVDVDASAPQEVACRCVIGVERSVGVGSWLGETEGDFDGRRGHERRAVVGDELVEHHRDIVGVVAERPHRIGDEHALRAEAVVGDQRAQRDGCAAVSAARLRDEQPNGGGRLLLVEAMVDGAGKADCQRGGHREAVAAVDRGWIVLDRQGLFGQRDAEPGLGRAVSDGVGIGRPRQEAACVVEDLAGGRQRRAYAGHTVRLFGGMTSDGDR